MGRPAKPEPPPLTEDQRALVVEWMAQWKPIGLMKRTFHGTYRVAVDVGLPDEDVSQSALLGVCGAARRFETDRGAGFGTYASWNVRAEVQSAIDRHRGRRYRAGEKAEDQPRTLSLDAQSDDGGRMLALLFDEREADRQDRTEAQAEARELVERLLAGLDERCRRVLVLRYGLFGGVRHTLAEAGAAIGVSKERARQIVLMALEKLRTVAV